MTYLSSRLICVDFIIVYSLKNKIKYFLSHLFERMALALALALALEGKECAAIGWKMKFTPKINIYLSLV